MTRAWEEFKWLWKLFRGHPTWLRWLKIKTLPRPAYCDCCGGWTWCTSETPARTTGSAWLCTECADENDAEWDAAWSEYYGGRL